MPNPSRAASSSVAIKVELFGTARLASGRREVGIEAPSWASVSDIAAALAVACPELIGKVILEDGSRLQSSFVFNINGAAFLSDERVELKPGDSILLFSSQAGG